MKSGVIAACLTSLLSLQGCVYFNTYYNTKKFYKEALEEHKRRKEDKPSSAEIQKLDKTIEKASKILQVYDQSKYVDDALLILGECFFYKQEYLKAVRKFEELTTLFPKSGLVPKAQLWKVRTHIELDDYASAEQVLKEIQAQTKKGDVFNEAQYYLGEIYYRQETYPQAAEAFELAAEKVSDKKMRAQACMRLGECRFELKQFPESAKAYKQAVDLSRELDFTFKANLAYARSLKAAERYPEAQRRLNKMLNEYTNHVDLPWVRFEIGDCILRSGRKAEAENLFISVTENHRRTEAAAAAYHALGEIAMFVHHDYEKAKSHFDKVQGEHARSDRIEDAKRNAKALDDYLRLKSGIALLEMQQSSTDSGGAASGSAAAGQQQKTRASSARRVSIRRLPTKSLAVSNDPARLKNDLARSKVSLGDLFQYQLDLPDSAMHEYIDVIEDFGDSEAAPRAMFALAYLLETKFPESTALRDSLLNVLASKHGRSPHGAEARRRLGLPPLDVDTALSPADRYRKAEESLVVKDDPHEAIKLYQELLEVQPESEWAPKSLYAIGWIYENELAEMQQAYESYKQLVEKFPNTDYSNKVRRKVTAFEAKQNGVPIDSLAQVTGADSLQQIQAPPPNEFQEDPRRIIQEPQPASEAVPDTSENALPEDEEEGDSEDDDDPDP